MRVLVTGSSGFVGSHLVEALFARGDDVLGIDRRHSDPFEDLRDPAVARRAVLSFAPDAIVHLASTCSTPGSVKEPLITFYDTVATAANVLDAAREAKTPTIILSSVKARDGMTPYGAAKRMVETWALECQTAFGIPVVINRPGTIYGPGQEGSEDSGWIAWFCQARKDGRPVTINGTGEQVRDLLHVSDMVRLLLVQLDDIEAYTHEIWDVGGGEENSVSVNEMASWLRLAFRHGPARYGDARKYVAKNGVPGWKPTVDWRYSETLKR